MRKLYTLTAILFFFSLAANAQRRIVYGFLKDSITQLPIPSGTITNANTKKNVRTEQNGNFLIEVAPNDVLYAVAKDYKFDTLHYSTLSKDTIAIYLPPSDDIMETVTVEASYAKYQADSIRRRREYESDRGQTYSKIDQSRSEGFGVAVNLDAIFKKKNNRKRSERNYEQTEDDIYYNFRYPIQLVSMYTGYKGDELVKFYQFSRPSVKWLKEHPSREELVYYINEKLKQYKAQKKRA
jgi:hypothetical protein